MFPNWDSRFLFFDGNIVTVEDKLFTLFSQEKLLNMNHKFTSSNSQTDWNRLDRMTDEEIDFSDCPEITPEMVAKAVVRRKFVLPYWGFVR
jgi:hypothetical protein